MGRVVGALRVPAAAVLLAGMGFAAPALAQPPPGPRVLFLGNSSHAAKGGSLVPFEGYCSATGITCEAIHNYDVFGPPPDGRVSPFWPQLAQDQRLEELLARESFDYVVLWTRHYAVDDRLWGSTVEGLKAVVPVISASGATTVLAMSYTSVDDLHTLDHVEGRFAQLQQEAKALRVGGSPPPVVYVPFGRFWGDGVARFGRDAWYSDRVHGSRLAQYATGCLWYTFLLDRDPRGVAFSRLTDYPGLDESERNQPVPAEAVAWIQERTWELYQASR
jgi:hypothetical protein